MMKSSLDLKMKLSFIYLIFSFIELYQAHPSKPIELALTSFVEDGYSEYPKSTIKPSTRTTTTSTTTVDEMGIVDILSHNQTVYSNRNVTITCTAKLNNRLLNPAFPLEKVGFTNNARLFLTLLRTPREKYQNPINQMSNFVECKDPNRTICEAVFNFDISCIESRLPAEYYLGKSNYHLETACQVDDSEICSEKWLKIYPSDCHKIGRLNVLYAPRIGKPCTPPHESKTKQIKSQTCGENQICDPNYRVCQCSNGFLQISQNDRLFCMPENVTKYWTDVVDKNSKLTTSKNYKLQEYESEEVKELKEANFRYLIKWTVFFF